MHNQESDSGSEYSKLYDTYFRDCEWNGDILTRQGIQLGRRKTEKKEKPY